MKGRGMPVIGMMPIVMPTFWNTWNTSMDSTPMHMSVPSRSLAIWAVRQMRMAMSAQAEHGGRPDEAHLLPQRGEDEVGVLLRHEAEPGLGALEQPLAGCPARGDRRLGLGQVPVGGRDRAVRGLRDETRQPVALVLGQH